MGELDLTSFKRMIETFRASFPDLTPTILGSVTEGDVVCTWWRCTGTYQKPLLGAAPRGQKLSVEGITFDRFRNGKLVESTSHWDTLGFLQGIGLVPKLDVRPPAQAERRPSM
jgi:predicted ester cyclase